MEDSAEQKKNNSRSTGTRSGSGSGSGIRTSTGSGSGSGIRTSTGTGSGTGIRTGTSTGTRTGSGRLTAEQKVELELETLLQEHRIKEKQLLEQWKDVRATEKKIRVIMRNQSREKQGFILPTIQEYDPAEYIAKHDGCNSECKKEKCASWLLESGLS